MDILKIENAFKLIGKDWALITVKNGNKVNTMTASWGGFGQLWRKNVVYIFIRPQRYTYEFAENSDYFSLSFFDEKYKKELSYLGAVSGRDEDKIAKVGFNINIDGEYADFDEAQLVLKCKKLYKQRISPEGFVDKSIQDFYAKNDYHYMYIGEVVKVEKK